MSKIEDLKQTYIKDADMMASKPRFGYFSIPPTATAGDNAFEDKKVIKDQNGRVKTQQRNIFSGITASGVLKKSFFNYETSVFQGDLYTDPGKKQRLEKLEQSKKLAEKDVYKPLSLVKTPEPKASYEHVPEKPVKKNAKDYVDENGKVKTQNRNIMTNSFSSIEKQKIKQFKYIPDPYQNNLKLQSQEHKKEVSLRGQAPFKLTSSSKPQFYTNRQTYGTDSACLVKKQKKQKLNVTTEHDGKFKPSCSSKFDTFSYPQYIPGGTKPAAKTTRPDPSKQSFKLSNPHQKSKPSPSISTLKTNLLRSIR